jgi:RNA polymerase sigma-70 factor (ECF subfamily)
MRDKGRDRLVLNEEVVLKIAEESVEVEPRRERQREALEICMNKVPADQRALIMQAYQPESRIQEVAQGSGRTVAGFYQWLHRMRKLLLECIRRALTQEVAS